MGDAALPKRTVAVFAWLGLRLGDKVAQVMDAVVEVVKVVKVYLGLDKSEREQTM